MLLSVPIKPNDFGFKELIKALEDCPSIQDTQKRKDVIGFLEEIGKQVEERSTMRESLCSILKVLSGFPDKFDLLLEAINFYEQNNEYYKKLLKVVIEIAGNQQQELEKIIEQSFSENIDSVLGTDSSKIEANFEDNWSSLYPILEDIDWVDIWNACDQVFKLNKSNDWRDRVKLKSICFTKNFTLLKKFFLEDNDPGIITIFAQTIKELLNQPNQALVDWLHNLQCSGTSNVNNIEETENCNSIPVLLIISDKNTINNTWTVQAQLKYLGIQEKIELERNNIIGIQCDEFAKIPLKIEAYIDYLNNNPKFERIPTNDLPVEKLRIEVFIPILNLNINFDCWAAASQKDCKNYLDHENYLVQSNRLFLRSRERYKGKKSATYKRMLEKGWQKLAQNTNQNIQRILLTEEIDDTEPDAHEILIAKNNQINNWTKLKNFMVKCNNLWGVRLQDTLPEDINERGSFLNNIFLSGIPIVCWHWDSISDEIRESIESQFNDCFCHQHLSERCHNLLEKFWELRSNAWGEADEAARRQSPGYYFAMLLEDPEIMPDDAPLKTVGGHKVR